MNLVGVALISLVLVASVATIAEARGGASGVPSMPRLRNSSSLAAARSESEYLAVLYTASNWQWCTSCRSLRNATDVVRRHLLTTLRTKYVAMRTDSKGKPVTKAERDRLAKLRSQSPVDFAVFDCSGVVPNRPGHPCTTEAEGKFPTLRLYSGHLPDNHVEYGSSASSAYADTLGVWRFLRQHIVDLESFDAPPGSATSKDAVERLTPAPQAPTQPRAPLGELGAALSPAPTAHTLVLLYPPECLQCRDDLVVMEALATALPGSSVDELTFARAALDSSIREYLGVRADGPILALLSPPMQDQVEQSRPTIYTGPRDPTALLAFLAYHTRVDFPAEAVASAARFAELQAAALGTATARPVTNHVRAVVAAPQSKVKDLRSVDDFDAQLFGERSSSADLLANPAKSGIAGFRFVLFASDWTSSSLRVANVLNAFSNAAATYSRANAGFPVSFFVADLTNVNVSLATSAERRVPIAATPFVGWCRVSDCESKGLEVFPYEPAANSILAAIRQAALPELVSSSTHHTARAAMEDLLVAPAAPGSGSSDSALAPKTKEGSLDRFATLEPITATSEHDALNPASETDADDFDTDLTFALPTAYYQDLSHLFVLVTFHGTDNARSESARALARFEKAATRLNAERRVIREYRRKSSSMLNDTLPDIQCGVLDGSRFLGLVREWSQRSAVVGEAFVVHIQRDKSSTAKGPARFGISVVTFDRDGDPEQNRQIGGTTRVPDEPFGAVIADTLQRTAGGPIRYDKNLIEVTPNTFPQLVLDETKGVLVLFMTPDDPHSLSVLPNLAEASLGFVKDQYQLTFATMDVAQIGPELMADLQLAHYPQLRWYPRGVKQLAGETVDLTPYREALIEFVSEEMGFAHMDLQMDAETDDAFTPVNGKDIADKLVHDVNSTVILYAYSGRAVSDRRLSILKRVAYHFNNASDPERAAHLAVLSQAVAAGADFDDDELHESAPATDKDMAKMRTFRFYRVDALRHRKTLSKLGFTAITERSNLPTLVMLPVGINKNVNLRYFPSESTFWVVSISRWLVHETGLDPLTEDRFNFTTEEYANDRDPPLVNVQDLDESSFVPFMGGGGDRVVLYYAQWCRHSQIYMSTFSKAAEHFAAGATDVKFGRVDVPNNAHIGHHQGIQAFPTVTVYFEGAADREQHYGEVFRGEKTADALIRYVDSIRGTSKVGLIDAARTKRRERVQPLLSDEAFAALVEQPRDFSVVVEFSATWCGHCRHAEEVLGDLAAMHEGLGHSLRTVRIDAEDVQKTAIRYNATANFPVIYLFPPQPKAKPGEKAKFAHYRDARFFVDIENFYEAQDAALKVTDVELHSYEDKRNREDAYTIEKLTVKPSVKSADSNDKKKLGRGQQTPIRKVHAPGSHDTPKYIVTPDGEELEMPGADGSFRGFPPTVKQLTEEKLLATIDNGNVALVLHYATPGDEEIMTTFAAVAEALDPALKKQILVVGAIESGNYPALKPLIGPAPSLTMFRGYAHPSMVQFEQAPGAEEGMGGDLRNMSDVLAFAHKHLERSRVTSIELTDKNYEVAANNQTLTVGVFFYAPWCEECRPAAVTYDQLAQSLGHRDDVVLTRVDVSRTPKPYRLLGSHPLPQLIVYDRLASPVRGAERRPRVFEGDKTRLTRDGMREFLRLDDDVRAAAANADSLADAENLLIDDDRAAAEEDKRSRTEIAADERELRRKLDITSSAKPLTPMMIPSEAHLNLTRRDFPSGVLVLFTARWCAHCKSVFDEFSALVPALRDLMVVAVVDITEAPAVLGQYDVTSLPAVVHLSKKWGAVTFSSTKRTREAILKFALRLAPATPDSDLPLYTERAEEDTAASSEEEQRLEEEARRFPAIVLDDDAAASRALAAAASSPPPSADGVSRAASPATVLFATAPDCLSPRCAAIRTTANRVASALRHTGAIVAVVNTTMDGALARSLKLATIPAVHIRCGDYNLTKPFSALSAPLRYGRGQRARVKVDADETLVERVASLVDEHCIPRKKAIIDDITKARRVLAAEESRTSTDVGSVHELQHKRRKESVLVFLRSATCDSVLCRALTDEWVKTLVAAKSKTSGAASFIEFVTLDLTKSGNKALRRVLFHRRVQIPTLAYLSEDRVTLESTTPNAEETAELLASTFKFYSGAVKADSIIEFIGQQHRTEHTS
jgi:thioredoxin-like negative regulator of GroEL